MDNRQWDFWPPRLQDRSLFLTINLHVFISVRLVGSASLGSASLSRFLVLRVILEEQNFKNKSFELVLGFLELALNLIRFREANDSISGSKENTDSPWV